jgi:hypothetical protein
LDGVTRHDVKLLEDTLKSIVAAHPERMTLCLDAGYTGSQKLVEGMEYEAPIEFFINFFRYHHSSIFCRAYYVVHDYTCIMFFSYDLAHTFIGPIQQPVLLNPGGFGLGY